MKGILLAEIPTLGWFVLVLLQVLSHREAILTYAVCAFPAAIIINVIYALSDVDAP